MDVGYYLLATLAAAWLSCVRHRSSATVIFTLALRLEGTHGVLCRHAVGDSSEFVHPLAGRHGVMFTPPILSDRSGSGKLTSLYGTF